MVIRCILRNSTDRHMSGKMYELVRQTVFDGDFCDC